RLYYVGYCRRLRPQICLSTSRPHALSQGPWLYLGSSNTPHPLSEKAECFSCYETTEMLCVKIQNSLFAQTAAFSRQHLLFLCSFSQCFLQEGCFVLSL